MTRNYSPLRTPDTLTDDKDRCIRKLKSHLGPLKQQLHQLPLLEQKFLHLGDRMAALQRENSIMEGEYRLREESAARAQVELGSDIEVLKGQQREFALQLNDLVADNGALNSQLERTNLELGDHKDLSNNLVDKGQQLNFDCNKLKSANKVLAEQNLRLLHRSHSLGLQNDQLCLKTAQLRGFSTQLQTHKKIYIQKLQQFENDNNSLDEKVCGKEDVHESVVGSLKKQDMVLKMEEESGIQLEARADKLLADLNHIQSNTRLETEVGSDITSQTRSAHRALEDNRVHLLRNTQEIHSTTQQNQKVLNLNFQLKKDWDLCEQHLQNLIQQNQLLNRELEKFAEEDDLVMRLILKRRSRPVLSSYVLKSSRVTGL